MRSRANRRACAAKRKAQVAKVIKHVWLEPELAQDKKFVGRWAALRGKCSCDACRPRKAEKGKTKEDAKCKRKQKEGIEP